MDFGLVFDKEFESVDMSTSVLGGLITTGL